MKKDHVVIKTHMLPHAEMYTSNPDEQVFLTDIFKNTKKIYVYRDVRDVLVSAYYYKNAHKKNITFSEFIRKEKNIGNTERKMSRPEFWKFHMDSWASQNFDNILFIQYEDLLKNYDSVLNKIADFIGLDSNPDIVDVTIKKEKNILFEKIKKLLGVGSVLRTSVKMRKGVVGDYKNHFSKEDEDYLDEILSNQSRDIKIK